MIMKLPYLQDYVKISNLVPSKITITKVNIENCLAAVISQTKSHLFKKYFNIYVEKIIIFQNYKHDQNFQKYILY